MGKRLTIRQAPATEGSIFDAEELWLQREAEVRASAATMTRPDTRAELLEIARSYAKLARRARERASLK